jgi:Zn-dependent protease
VLAITLHEAAHAYAALKLGDRTAFLAGRVTLNPLAHIDFIGTVAIPLLLVLATKGAFAFGYAKPVPVNFARLQSPKEDMLWVAAAGPAANFAMFLAWFFLFSQLPSPPVSAWQSVLLQVAFYGIVINLSLFFLNLIPLPPLDGGRIVTSLLPMRLAIPYARIEPYGILILLLLLFSGGLDKLLTPMMEATFNLFQGLH